MIEHLQQQLWRDRRARVLAIATIVASLAASAYFAMHGKTSYACGMLAFPLLAWCTLEYPAVFPYGAYAMLVPMDNLLGLGGGSTVTRLLAIVSAAAFALRLLRERRAVAPSPAVWWCVAAIAYFACAMTWSVDAQNASRDFGTLLQLMGLFAIVSVVPLRAHEVRTVLVAVVIGGVLCALYAVWLFHGQATPLASADSGGRLMIAIGARTLDANLFSDSLLLPLAILAWMALRSGWAMRLTVCAPAGAVMLYAISLGASREAIVAIGVMGLYGAWRSRLRARLVPLLGLIAVVVALSPTLAHRFQIALSTGGAGRSAIWSVALRAFERHPLFGWGFGGFAEGYNRMLPFGAFQGYPAGWDRASHDLIVHYGVEGGIVGIALVLLVWMSQLDAARFLERIATTHGIAPFVIAAVIGLFVGGLFIDIFATKTLWLAFCLIAQIRSSVLAERTLEMPAMHVLRRSARVGT